jgi:16S rRNA (guanine966-N2)-methyltransferase
LGRLRIIAGEHRGRRIAVPPGSEVRPTADRVREALFSILGESVRRARVLDAYAGSGALGFEALSRGADHITFVEVEPRSVATLRANVESLAAGAQCDVLQGLVLELLEPGRIGGSFDLVLADPPYEAAEFGPFLARARRVLAPSGRIVLERDRRQEPLESDRLERTRTARYGRSCLDFYAHGGDAGAG